VIELALVEVDEDWWFDDPELWRFDDPRMELLAWPDPLLEEPDGPRARTAVEAKVRLSTVTIGSRDFETRRMTGSPVGVGGFLVEKAAGCIDPSTCHAESHGRPVEKK
jgi:hypothetical protein